ncbi:MAG TPA: SRPBCC family protein, partial [Candidatus Limnocylindrales bacterium]
MPHAENSIEIRRSVEDVFAFVADGENARQWRPAVLDVRRVSGEGVGARYAQGVRGPMGRRVAADYEITRFEPGQTIEFRTTAGPVRPRGWFEFRSVDGGTRLTFALDAELGGLRRLLLGSMVSSTM